MEFVVKIGRRFWGLLCLLLSLGFLGGCKIGPDYNRPNVETPTQWREQSAVPASLADLAWWDFYHDPVMTNLIAIGLTNNYDLRAAVARIEQAAGSYRAQRSALFPSLDASGAFSRSRIGNIPPFPDFTFNEFDLSGLLSYEVDVWGRVRRLTEAARAEMLAAEETRRTIYITLMASIASTYLDLLSLDEQAAISARTVASRQHSLELTQIKYSDGRGVVSAVDVREAETLLFSAQTSLLDFQRLIALRENELNLLLGRPPGPIARGSPLAQFHMPDTVPAGLPSDLLLRRPDIRAAEEQLIAANANIGAARAAYFPTISLTAALGLQSMELRNLFTPGVSESWQIAPRVVAPIFNAGRIRGGVDLARGRRQEMLIEYQRTIQTAFREVDDALVSIQMLGREVETQEKNTDAERARLDLSETRYQGGVASYGEVLDAQRYLFAAELTLTTLRAQQLTAAIQLYRALGGGWPAATPSR